MDYYDYIAAGYEELHKEEQEKKIRIMMSYLSVEKNERVLDLGSGPGFLELDCEVYRVDPSSELLKKASGKKVQAYAENLPFDDNYFDKIVSVTSMQNFSDIRKAVAEMKRVCKGDIILSFLKHSRKAPEIEEVLRENFTVERVIEEEKDMIFVIRR